MRVLDGASRKIAGQACTFGLLAALVAACGGGGSGSGFGPPGGAGGAGTGGTQGTTSDGMGGIMIPGTGTTGSGTSTGAGGSVMVPSTFVDADIGGYALGAPIMGDGVANTGVDSGDGCKILVGVVRDFRGSNEPGGHPDFEAFSGSQETPGLVDGTLGTDGKPVYAAHCDASGQAGCPFGQQMTTKDNFDEWYRYTSGVNQPYLLYLEFSEDPSTKLATFASTLFFPLDGAGFGDSGTGTDGKPHNFGFTTEIHTQFKYNGGEQFTFSGDDDLWVFINKKLAIDLGGLHPPATGTVDLDKAAQALGITVGNVYPLELFHAERHTEGSNFRVDTNLGFVDCGSIPSEPK